MPWHGMQILKKTNKYLDARDRVWIGAAGEVGLSSVLQ